MMRVFGCFLFVICYSIGLVPAPAQADSPLQQVTRRRPVDLIALPNNETLLCLNQRGTISFIDLHSRKPEKEIFVAQEPSAFCCAADNVLAVLDRGAHELRLFSLNSHDLQWISTVKVSHTPVRMRVAEDGKQIFVTSLWSHRWTTVDISNLEQPVVQAVIDLPFAPDQLIQLNDSNAFVAEAFGGRWAIINLEKQCVSRRGEFAGTHNVSGLAKGKNDSVLFMPHMTLTHEKPTTRFNVHWGDVMLNVVRSIEIVSLLDEKKDVSTNFNYLGRPDNATGDPTEIIVTKSGRQLVCFAGVGEIGISDVGVNTFDRVFVGARPEAIAMNVDESLVYVASKFDDTIAIVDINRSKLIHKISLGVCPPQSEEEKGERLFYDSRLSSDGWFSCHSCHTHGHSNGGLADTFGDEQEGDGKRVLSLLGVVETAPWSWRGGITNLRSQIEKSIKTTMRGPSRSVEDISALATYLSQLDAPPSKGEARNEQDFATIRRGQALFQREGCSDCHQIGTYTSDDIYDVGVVDQLGNRHFNPPSLRGISHRHRLFHDNRVESVRSVVTKLQHQLPNALDESAANDLSHFVESL